VSIAKRDFIVAWQHAHCLGNVVAATGLALSTVKKYASEMRKNGVALKALEDEGKKKTNWDELRVVADLMGGADGPSPHSKKPEWLTEEAIADRCVGPDGQDR